MNTRPILLVHARLSPAAMEEFEAWHQSTQLPHVLAIPGITTAYRVQSRNPIPGAHLMLFEFEDESVIQAALRSAEAQLARQAWERWTGELRELSIEIYAPLKPIAAFHQPN